MFKIKKYKLKFPLFTSKVEILIYVGVALRKALTSNYSRLHGCFGFAQASYLRGVKPFRKCIMKNINLARVIFPAKMF